jgi:hypothetical protein
VALARPDTRQLGRVLFHDRDHCVGGLAGERAACPTAARTGPRQTRRMAGATRGSSTARFSPMTSSSLGVGHRRSAPPTDVRESLRFRSRNGFVVARSNTYANTGSLRPRPLLMRAVPGLASCARTAECACCCRRAGCCRAIRRRTGRHALNANGWDGASRTGAAAGPATVYCDHLTKLSSTRGTHRNGDVGPRHVERFQSVSDT